MSARYFDPDEDAAFERAYANLQRVRSYSTEAEPQTVANVASVRAHAPWMPPATTYALAASGHDGTSEVTRAAAKGAAKRKVKRGLGWHSVGDFVTATADMVGDVAKPVVRTGFTVLSAPFEEAAGLLRSAAGTIGGAAGGLVAGAGGGAAVGAAVGSVVPVLGTAVGAGIGAGIGGLLGGAAGDEIEGEGGFRLQSSAGIALQRRLRGQRVDLGSGFLPGGDVARAQAAAARRTATIDGRALTTGRLLATSVVEPGTTPYNILSGLTDATVAIRADPAAFGLATTARARQAAKVFHPPSAGLVEGRRLTVLPERTREWLAGDGADVVEYLATETNLNRMRRTVKGKLPVDLLRELTDATTVDEVKDVLGPRLGTTLRSTDELAVGRVARFAPEFRKRLDGVRLLQQMPGTHVDVDNLDSAVETMDRFMRNAKLPGELVDRRIDELARTTNNEGRYKVVTDILSDTTEHLGQFTDKPAARRLTTMFSNYQRDFARYFVDEIGNDVPVLGATVDGAALPLPTPHLLVEYLDRTLPLPDARDIRAATSRYRAMVEKVPGLRQASKGMPVVLDWLQQDIWKPLVLLRGAWTVRVISEEQVRMGASGLDSLFRHPLSALAWATGRRGASGVTGEFFKDASEAAADLDEFAQAMSRNGGGWRDRVAHMGKRIVRKGEEQYADSLADELLQLRSDPVASRVAGGWSDGDRVPGGLTGNHVGDAKRWFWEGPGKVFRQQIGDARGREAILTDRAVADAYIDSVFDRVQVKTAGDARLVEAVATGALEGSPIREGLAASKQFRQRVAELVDTEDLGPAAVKGDITLTARGSAGSRVAEQMDKAVDVMFDTLMSRPTNYLSRSPAFRQFYWQRVEELIPGMAADAQQAALRAAAEAKLAPVQLRRLGERARRAQGALALEDADTLAKGFGLERTKDLLYDLTERSQFFDVTRHIFPFGEAWKEVGTRWARIGLENPQVLRRGQQVVEGARGSGFFYTDETTGEEMFAYPGSELVTEKLLGVPVPFGGRVQGLNIFGGTVLPGFGLAVTMPAGALLPDKPEWDSVRDILMPFGEVETEGGVFESFLPAWMQKFRQAGLAPFGRQDERVWNNTVFDMVRHLVSTGEYGVGSVEDQERTLEEAKRKAKWLYALRGAAQFFAPSAPTPQFLAMDADGRLLVAQTLVEDFAAMQEEDWETAPQRFLAKYGDTALLYMQGKTEGKFPATSAARDWQRSHPELAERYPDVYGFFAPQGEDFDIEAYMRQIRSGERVPVAPKEAVERANARVAGMVYRQAREQLGNRTDAAARAWLAQLREALVEDYPGYDPGSFNPGEVQARVRQVIAATEEELVASTPAGRATVEYLRARDQAIEQAQAADLATFGRAARARPLRDWLRDVAATLSERHPEFAEVYERVFEREMADDAEEVAA